MVNRPLKNLNLIAAVSDCGGSIDSHGTSVVQKLWTNLQRFCVS